MAVLFALTTIIASDVKKLGCFIGLPYIVGSDVKS